MVANHTTSLKALVSCATMEAGREWHVCNARSWSVCPQSPHWVSEIVIRGLVSSGWTLAWWAAGSQVQFLGHGGRQAGRLEQRSRRDLSEGLLCQYPGLRDPL